jgi:hypothetical protein
MGRHLLARSSCPSPRTAASRARRYRDRCGSQRNSRQVDQGRSRRPVVALAPRNRYLASSGSLVLQFRCSACDHLCGSSAYVLRERSEHRGGSGPGSRPGEATQEVLSHRNRQLISSPATRRAARPEGAHGARAVSYQRLSHVVTGTPGGLRRAPKHGVAVAAGVMRRALG